VGPLAVQRMRPSVPASTLSPASTSAGVHQAHGWQICLKTLSLPYAGPRACLCGRHKRGRHVGRQLQRQLLQRHCLKALTPNPMLGRARACASATSAAGVSGGSSSACFCSATASMICGCVRPAHARRPLTISPAPRRDARLGEQQGCRACKGVAARWRGQAVRDTGAKRAPRLRSLLRTKRGRKHAPGKDRHRSCSRLSRHGPAPAIHPCNRCDNNRKEERNRQTRARERAEGAQSSTPNENTSAALLTTPLDSTSGAMCVTVPVVFVSILLSTSMSRASPKSDTWRPARPSVTRAGRVAGPPGLVAHPWRQACTRNGAAPEPGDNSLSAAVQDRQLDSSLHSRLPRRPRPCPRQPQVPTPARTRARPRGP